MKKAKIVQTDRFFVGTEYDFICPICGNIQYLGTPDENDPMEKWACLYNEKLKKYQHCQLELVSGWKINGTFIVEFETPLSRLAERFRNEEAD